MEDTDAGLVHYCYLSKRWLRVACELAEEQTAAENVMITMVEGTLRNLKMPVAVRSNCLGVRKIMRRGGRLLPHYVGAVRRSAGQHQ